MADVEDGWRKCAKVADTGMSERTNDQRCSQKFAEVPSARLQHRGKECVKGFAPKRRALSREAQPGALRARLERSSTWRLRVHAARCAAKPRCSKRGTWVEGAGGAAGEADLASNEIRAACLTPGTRQRSDA